MASLFKTNEAKYHMWLLQIKQLNHFTLSAICENIGAMIIVEDEHATDEWRQRKRRKKNYLYSIHHGANTILVWWNDLNQAREKAKIWVEKTVHSENLIETHYYSNVVFFKFLSVLFIVVIVAVTHVLHSKMNWSHQNLQSTRKQHLSPRLNNI